MIAARVRAAGRVLPARGGLRTRVRRALRDDDSGMALVMVVGTMLVLAMLAMTALAYTMQSQKFARRSQDYSAAQAAAQSGVEDYLSRLNRNDQYGRTVDCTNAALRGPMDPLKNACGYTSFTAAGWLPVVQGETDPSAAWFHVALDNSFRSDGVLGLTVTGRVNGQYRTVDGAVGKAGSTDYIYYTDFESADPSNVQAYAPSGATVPACGAGALTNARYFYSGRSGQGCTEITFIAADKLDGAVFSNDAILSDGAKITNGLMTANPSCVNLTTNQSTWNNCLRSGSTANFNNVRPQLTAPKYLDDTSAAFKTTPGCHYYGSTRVIFNAGGTMTVWNKKVNNGNTPPLSIPEPGGVAPDCGDFNLLDTTGSTVAVPPEMVLYVGIAPVSVVRRQCDSDEIGGASGRTLPLGTLRRASLPSPVTFGSAYTYTYDTNMTESNRYCAEGNLYVEGTLNGRVTVAAAQSVIVTGDLVLAGGITGDDMLGIVATNSVEVYHPRMATYSSMNRNADCVASPPASYRYCPGTTSAPATTWPTRYVDPTFARNEPSSGIQIAGSIQTLQHSFLVQKYGEGSSLGTLEVNGSIAQRWRGIVGTSGSGGTGYTKQYTYDSRLVLAPPPYFPRWSDSQWSLRYSGEINTLANVRS